MRKRPFSLFLCAAAFLYFPMEYGFRWLKTGQVNPSELIIEVVLPIILLVGLVRVTKFGWYTLVALVAFWGVDDLYQYYSSQGLGLKSLLVHIAIYGLSLAYFINPRVRHVYFDPKLRWWRTKPRYETHGPALYQIENDWNYPVLRNISEGGCFLETAHPHEVNSIIDVRLPLPVPLGISVIRAQGEVRWVSHGSGRQGMGVQFIDPPPDQLQAIHAYVQQQL